MCCIATAVTCGVLIAFLIHVIRFWIEHHTRHFPPCFTPWLRPCCIHDLSFHVAIQPVFCLSSVSFFPSFQQLSVGNRAIPSHSDSHSDSPPPFWAAIFFNVGLAYLDSHNRTTANHRNSHNQAWVLSLNFKPLKVNCFMVPSRTTCWWFSPTKHLWPQLKQNVFWSHLIDLSLS